MAGWHHRHDGHEFEWTPEVGDGQGGLACCDSWGHKELDTTEQLNWTELNWTEGLFYLGGTIIDGLLKIGWLLLIGSKPVGGDSAARLLTAHRSLVYTKFEASKFADFFVFIFNIAHYYKDTSFRALILTALRKTEIGCSRGLIYIDRSNIP